MKIYDGGPAFPVTTDTALDPDSVEPMMGMSLRHWYAGMALQGILASQHQEAFHNPDKAATFALEFADAMLAQRGEGDE